MKIVFPLIFLLCSCSDYKIKKFSLYTPTIIDKLDPYPTQEELKERVKIVVMVDDQTNVDIPNFNQKQIAVSSVTQLLDNLKTVDVLDRNIIKSIKEEAMLSEIKSGKPVIENKNADYVILIKLNSLTFSSEYDARTFQKMSYSASQIAMMVGGAVATNGRGVYVNIGGTNPISGEYDYRTVFNGEISVVELPSGEIKSKIPLNAVIENSEDAQENGLAKAKEFDTRAMEKAIKSSVQKSAVKISKIVPAVGHIIQRSDYRPDEPVLFKISFGAIDGIQPGDNVNLVRKIYEVNPLTNEQMISIKNTPLGEVVANQFGDNFCWIKVEDSALASTVRIADKVIVNVRPKIILDDDE